MSDFSEYGGVADDWERVFATSPRAELPGGLSALEQRRLTNDYREASSRKFTQTIGKWNIGTESSFTRANNN